MFQRMSKIQITSGDVTVQAELYDSPTGKAVAAILPIEATVTRWGGEIYYSIPATAELEDDAREVLESGELGYWPPGSAFCIFFGATPISRGDECRAASKVNVFGKVLGDTTPLWDMKDGQNITVTTA